MFKQAELVLVYDLAIDGCVVELKGTKLIFREDSVNNPTLTISNGGSLIMSIDADTGDTPKIFGEGNLDAVDIAIASGGTLDMQAGSMKNFLLSGSKTGQLVVQSGGALGLGGQADFDISDSSAAGVSQDFPVIHADGGVVVVSSSPTIAGSSNLGIGVALTNGGELNGAGLTVANMLTGIDSDAGSLTLIHTSTDNTMVSLLRTDHSCQRFSLVQPYRASHRIIQHSTQPLAQIPGLDNCYFRHEYGCFGWEEYTVDLTSWVGQEDYLQPSMMINYGGTYRSAWSGHGSHMSLDNLYVEITDDQGVTYTSSTHQMMLILSLCSI